MSTESISSRYRDLDLWPTGEAVQAMLESQLAAAAAVQPRAKAIAAAADEAAARLRDGGRLIYAGAGTSGRIAVQDGVELGPTFGWPVERFAFCLAGGAAALQSSIEGAEDDTQAATADIGRLAPRPDDVAIGVSASGATPYTIAVVEAASAAGALTIGLACNPDTPLLRAADHPFLLDTGPEVLAGSTRMKAGTAQKIALNLLSTAVMLRLGRVYRGLMVDMRLSNDKLRARAVEIIRAAAGVDADAAAEALERAGSVKAAILTALGASPDESGALLSAAGGDLRAAIERLKK